MEPRLLMMPVRTECQSQLLFQICWVTLDWHITHGVARQNMWWAGQLLSSRRWRMVSKLLMHPVQGPPGALAGRFSTSCAAPAATAGCRCSLRQRSRCVFLYWLCREFELYRLLNGSGLQHHVSV